MLEIDKRSSEAGYRTDGRNSRQGETKTRSSEMREDRWKVERHLVEGKRQRDLRLERELGSTGCRSCESQEAAIPIEGKQGCWIAVHQNQ